MTGTADYRIPGNIKTPQGEIKNTKYWMLNDNPSGLVEGLFWFDSVNHKPKYYDGTSVQEYGRIYTQGTGITISAGNEVSVTDYAKLLKNTATGTSSLTVDSSNACAANYSINIGNNSKTTKTNSVVVGVNAQGTGKGSTAIGCGTNAQNDNSTAVGNGAITSANGAIQLGWGTNSNNYSLGVGFYYDINTEYEWKLLDGTTGLIPDARLSSNILKSSDKGVANGVASLGSDGKVPSSQLPAYVDDVIELLTMGSAPSTCVTGDKYFNTTSNKIFTATATNTWGTTGADPIKDIIYVRTDTNGSYRWSGSSMINIANPIGAATESAAGIAEIATTSEVSTGTDDTRIVTPLKLATYYQKKLTQSTGITIDGSSNISVTDYDKLLKNKAGGSGSYTIGGQGAAGTSQINIGNDSKVSGRTYSGTYAIGIGDNSIADARSVALGGYAEAATTSSSTTVGSIAIGYSAKTSVTGSIQLLHGTNSTANTFQVKDYTFLDLSTGIIPDDRISSTIKNGAAAGATAVQKYAANNTVLTASGGVATWEITHGLGTDDVMLVVKDISTGEIIFPAWKITSGKVTIEFLASANIAADTYRAIIMG